MMTDRAIGKTMLAVNTLFIVYYILWIGVMPFVDQSHFTQRLFPMREYGLLLAALIMVTGMGGSVILASVHTILRTGYHEELVVHELHAAEQSDNALSPSPQPPLQDGM